MLVPFVSGKLRKPADRLAVRDLSSKRVLQFLAHLEDERGCSIQARNQRLTAIRAFARFVAGRDPGSYRMVRPNPCDSIEEGNATAYHLADQDRDECHARCSRPEDLTRSNRIRSSAVPLTTPGRVSPKRRS